METNQFDDIAKAVARGMSRRRLLKALTGTVAGSVLGIAGLASADAFICRQPAVLCTKDAHCCSGVCGADHRCACADGQLLCGRTCAACCHDGDCADTDVCQLGACISRCMETGETGCAEDGGCCVGNVCCDGMCLSGTSCCEAQGGTTCGTGCCSGDTPKCCAGGGTCIASDGCCDDGDCSNCQTCDLTRNNCSGGCDANNCETCGNGNRCQTACSACNPCNGGGTCVDNCTNCQTCDTNSGQCAGGCDGSQCLVCGSGDTCVAVGDGTSCGTDQVCCHGTCCASEATCVNEQCCASGTSCDLGALKLCCPNSTDHCVGGGCCPSDQVCGASCCTSSQVCNAAGTACATSCDTDDQCLNGHCCGIGCVDITSDPANCGLCGHACSAGEICVTGACTCGTAGACDGGLTCCDGSCVDLRSDLNNCSACGQVCAMANAVTTCEYGDCVFERCHPGYVNCDGRLDNGCESYLASDPNNCGACGNACDADETCCGGRCVPMQSDANNCGACGHACGRGQGCCGGKCIDVWWDINNCGSCDHVCDTPHTVETCSLGHCAITGCKDDYTWCVNKNNQQVCTDLTFDPNNCGACGHVCDFSHGQGRCQNGVCKAYTCDESFTLCTDSTGATTCKDLRFDYNNCGACGNVCPCQGQPGGQCFYGQCCLDHNSFRPYCLELPCCYLPNAGQDTTIFCP